MMMGAKRSKYYSALDNWGPIFAVPGATFVNVQSQEVVGLEEHVGKLGEGESDVVAVQPALDRLLGDHLIHREMFTDVTQKIRQTHRR